MVVSNENHRWLWRKQKENGKTRRHTNVKTDLSAFKPDWLCLCLFDIDVKDNI